MLVEGGGVADTYAGSSGVTGGSGRGTDDKGVTSCSSSGTRDGRRDVDDWVTCGEPGGISDVLHAGDC